MKTIENRIREKRKEANMTLEELEKKSGISRQRIAQIETNNDMFLAAKTKTLVAISDALGVPLAELIF